MEKKTCLLHIWPNWLSVLVIILPYAAVLVGLIAGRTLNGWVHLAALFLVPLIFLPLLYFNCQSLSFYPNQLILRCAGIPIRRIPIEKLDGVVLIPAHRSGRRSVPPTVAAVLKPGTIDRYCNERGLTSSSYVNCPHVSTYFNAHQEYTIWATLEANGISVTEFDDVLYRG